MLRNRRAIRAGRPKNSAKRPEGAAETTRRGKSKNSRPGVRKITLGRGWFGKISGSVLTNNLEKTNVRQSTERFSEPSESAAEPASEPAKSPGPAAESSEPAGPASESAKFATGSVAEGPGQCRLFFYAAARPRKTTTQTLNFHHAAWRGKPR